MAHTNKGSKQPRTQPEFSSPTLEATKYFTIALSFSKFLESTINLVYQRVGSAGLQLDALCIACSRGNRPNSNIDFCCLHYPIVSIMFSLEQIQTQLSPTQTSSMSAMAFAPGANLEVARESGAPKGSFRYR